MSIWAARCSTVLARRHDLSRTLIRIWVDEYDAGAFHEVSAAADTIQSGVACRDPRPVRAISRS